MQASTDRVFKQLPNGSRVISPAGSMSLWMEGDPVLQGNSREGAIFPELIITRRQTSPKAKKRPRYNMRSFVGPYWSKQAQS